MVHVLKQTNNIIEVTKIITRSNFFFLVLNGLEKEATLPLTLVGH